MSKKKRSKILATLLCATTMAAFYVSPQIGYAVDLYYKTDGSGEVVINGGGTNTKIEDLSGIASITFGTPGEQGEGGVRFFLDAQEFGGVRAEGAFTANDLYIMVDPKGEGTERYSLRNVMGIYRNQDQITGEYATSIESGISGGGMQITNDTINMLDGTIAISTEKDAKYNISFDGKFNSEQGMTVGTDYTLDNRGNITTKGTFNGMEINEDKVNDVTLKDGSIIADEVTAGSGSNTYKLTEVGQTVNNIDKKTQGILNYDSNNGTTFNGKITAISGIVTSDVHTNTLNTTSIVSGSESFTVHEAKEAIDWVDEWDSKVSGYDGRITKNETDIATLEKTVGDEREGLVKDVSDLQTATTGMTYNQSTGTTFAQAVTANDFKIAGGTSLSQVATDLTTAQGNIQTNTNNITTLTSKVTTAESEIDVLQTTVGDENSGLVAKTKNLNADGSTLTGMTNIITNTFTATSGSIGSIGFSGNNLTNVASIGGVGNTVTVAGTAISNGSFNSVSINNFISGTGATINGISIYQDSDGHYNVGTIDLNDLTGSGSSGTVDGIVRTDNTPKDKEDNDYTTTIEGNLEVRTNGTITQRNGDFAVAADGTVTGKDFAVKGTGTTLSGVASNVTALQTTVGNQSSGLVKNVNDLNTTVSGHTTSINALNTKSKNLSEDGMQLTDMDNIESAKGKIGGISFDGNAITNVTSIGSDTDTINIAGTPISKGSFNSVSISNYTSNGSTGATINGISIYKEANDYIVGDVNLSKLKGVSGTEIEGIERTDNTPDAADDNNFTTTIEGTLKVNTDGTFSNANESFKVDVDGNVTGKDFVIKGVTSLSTVAQATTGMTYTAGNTTAEGVTSFDHNVHATNFTTDSADLNELSATVGDANSGLVQNVNALNTKTTNLSADGSTLTDMTNIESAAGTIGGISFATVNGVKTIGTDSDTITLAGNAISKGSFNGVNIGVDGSNHATFNGVSIYQDTNNDNDVMVGGINISELQSTTGTKLEGIVREPNEQGGGYTTTIEGSLAVNSATGNVTVDGEVTANDFRVGDTTFTNVASNVTNLNTVTTGMTYTPAGNDTQPVTSFNHEVQATNITTNAGADLNKLSATVGDENSGLVQSVNTLNNKTTNLSPDGSSLTNMTNIESAAGTIGGISFATVNGVKTIGTDSDTITLAGNAISQGSFNGVDIGVDGSNHATFNGVSIYTDSANKNAVMVGGINISALQSGNTEITNKLKGITYRNDDENNYTMTFAGTMSVSTDGTINLGAGDKVGFSYNGHDYTLDDLINEGDYSALAGRVEALEDKTTGISYDKGTGSTTITSGDNSLTVGDGGITANGDTVINGDTDDNTTGGNGNGSSDPQGGDSIINGDQLVNGDQHVTGDSQFDGTVTVGTGTDGNGQIVIDGGNITTGDTIIDGGSVTSKEGHFDNINVGSGENATTIGESGIQVGDNTTIDNSGVSIKDENSNVFMGDHDVVIKDSDGNVEASLSDVANRVDGIEQSIGDLNSRMGELEDRIDKVGAMAAAIANLRTMGYDPAAPTEVAVGIGQYRNETGAALGLFHYPNRDFMLSLSVSTSGDEVMGGIGATWKFGRKSPEKVAAEKAEKAREAKLQKAEAIKEAARLKKIEAQQERHAKLAAQKTATK